MWVILRDALSTKRNEGGVCAAQPWSQAYVFFKHEDEGAAPRLARRLMELASARETV